MSSACRVLSQPTPRRFLMNSASSVVHFLIIWNDTVSPSQWRTWCGDQHLLDLFSTRTDDDSIRSVVTLNLKSGLLKGVCQESLSQCPSNPAIWKIVRLGGWYHVHTMVSSKTSTYGQTARRTSIVPCPRCWTALESAEACWVPAAAEMVSCRTQHAWVNSSEE